MKNFILRNDEKAVAVLLSLMVCIYDGMKNFPPGFLYF